MNHLFLSKVGDGLCLTITTRDSMDYFQMDCGSRHNAKAAAEGWGRAIRAFYAERSYPHSSSFILSHFHDDHYNGVLYAAKNKMVIDPGYKIDQLYYHGKPSMVDDPSDDRLTEFYRALFTLNEYQFLLDPTLFFGEPPESILGRASGLMELDLINAIRKINNRSDLPHRPLFMGDNFAYAGKEFKCLWPPKRLSDGGFRAEVAEALDSFYQALDENEVLRRIYEIVGQQPQFTALVESSAVGDNSPVVEVPGDEILNEIPAPTMYTTTLEKANAQMRKVANCLSLVLQYENELLLCGDLQGKQLGMVMRNLPASDTHFNIMVAPHHGTHWHRDMNRLEILYTLTSDGDGLHSKLKLKNQLEKISGSCVSTFSHGDIKLSRSARHIKTTP